MEGELFLGKVSINGASWARLEPLAVRTSGRWKRLENAVETFPTQGKVFSTRPLVNAPTDSLWTFTRRPNERPNGPDLQIADDIVRAIPIVDLSAISLEMARRRLVVQGVTLTLESNSVTAVVLLIDELFCEVSLVRSEDGLWRSSSFTRPVQLKETPEGWASPVDFNGLRVLPAQLVPNGQVIRTINWCSDQDFVERVIERFRKFMMNVGDTSYARPSKDTVKYVARALRQADLMPEEENDIVLDMERLQADWPLLEERFDASEELGSFILGLKSTKQKIDAAVEEATRQAAEAARPQIERQVREEAETSLTDARLQAEALAREVENLAQRRALLVQDLKDLEERSAESLEQQKAITESVKLVAKDLRVALAQSPQQERATLAYIAQRLEEMLNVGGYRTTPLFPPSCLLGLQV